MSNVVSLLAGQRTFAFGETRITDEQARSALQTIVTEQALLGSLLTQSALFSKLPPTFSPDHYGDELHREIHIAAAEIAGSSERGPIAVLIVNAIGATDQEKRSYIASLLTAAVGAHPALVRTYAEAITDMHRRRGLFETGQSMQETALGVQHVGGGDAAVAIAMNRLDELLSVTSGRPHISLNDAMDAAIERADDVANGVITGISTGFDSIDRGLGSFDPGQMFILAGRPGMGKSALGWQMALNVARTGRGVLAISLEMSAMELGRRALCACAGVPLAALKHGRLPHFADRIQKARKDLNDLPLSIEESAGLTSGMISLKARAAKRRHGNLGLIMVDHMHIVRPDDADAKNGATWATGKVSGAMKRLAKDHECPALVLAQLNRGVEGRDDKRPGLSDLRQSGDIEQDADAVGFIYRAEYYLNKEPEQLTTETAEKYANRVTQHLRARDQARGKAELIFAKVRDGEAGTVPLNFHGETTSFSEVEA